MARVARLSGAIVVATEIRGEPAHFLVGDTKAPCDWGAAGFARPPERDPAGERYIRLQVTGTVRLSPPYLHIPAEGETAARVLADRMLVARNGSVSERLWRLVIGDDDESERKRKQQTSKQGATAIESIEARWLEEVPASVWNVVRDAVLRCT